MSLFTTAFVLAGICAIAAIGVSIIMTWVAAVRLQKLTADPETQDDFTVSIARWGKVQERIDQ
ncbi:MAG: hypothetical protein ACJAVZ_000060 [Afipia broomeae]|jgi:hypothetical protein